MYYKPLSTKIGEKQDIYINYTLPTNKIIEIYEQLKEEGFFDDNPEGLILRSGSSTETFDVRLYLQKDSFGIYYLYELDKFHGGIMGGRKTFWCSEFGWVDRGRNDYVSYNGEVHKIENDEGNTLSIFSDRAYEILAPLFSQTPDMIFDSGYIIGSSVFRLCAGGIRRLANYKDFINAQDFCEKMQEEYEKQHALMKDYFDKIKVANCLFKGEVDNYSDIDKRYFEGDIMQNVVSMNSMFVYSNLNSLSGEEIDTSNVLFMHSTFGVTPYLGKVENLYIGKVLDLRETFSWSGLKKAKLVGSQYVANGTLMFGGCLLLESVYMEKAFSTMENMFNNCRSLKIVVLNNDTEITEDVSLDGIFSLCCHFNGTQDDTYNPNGDRDGRIYVTDRLYDIYVENNRFGDYTNLLRPISQYTGE